MITQEIRNDLLPLTAQIIAAHAGKNILKPEDLSILIGQIYRTLASLGEEVPATTARPQPAVRPQKSVFPDYLVCLEDGKHMTMLKRHLQTSFGLTPDEYRKRWNLPLDYPMVAPNYAKKRSALAKKIGLGRHPGARRVS